ncbi:TIGR03643 family protein [Aquirufa nivalisilvae]|nr:TIGR03643 family protein [Aquirufa nivalisilvae]
MNPSICKELKSNIYRLKCAPYASGHFPGAKNGSEIGIKSCIAVKSVEEINKLTEEDTDRIIQMAWEDRTPFEAIEFQFGLKEKDVIEFMRLHSQRSSFQMWRKRMSGRITKHVQKRVSVDPRFKCSLQRSISLNKISKR